MVGSGGRKGVEECLGTHWGREGGSWRCLVQVVDL